MEEEEKRIFLIKNNWEGIRKRCLEVIRLLGHDIPIVPAINGDKENGL